MVYWDIRSPLTLLTHSALNMMLVYLFNCHASECNVHTCRFKKANTLTFCFETLTADLRSNH